MSLTNEEIQRQRQNVTIPQSYHGDVDVEEIKAFFGLLYFSGVQKTCNTNFYELWSTEFGSTLYQCTMSLHHLLFLLSTLRFDGKNTRMQPRAIDKFAPIRESWEGFVDNCKKYYTPHEYCTVDE